MEWAGRAGRCEGGSLPDYRLPPRRPRILERYRQRWDDGSLGEWAAEAGSPGDNVAAGEVFCYVGPRQSPI
jgi:hypothetical protein